MEKEKYEIVGRKGDCYENYKFKSVFVMASSHYQNSYKSTTLCGVSAAGIKKLNAMVADGWSFLYAKDVPCHPIVDGWTASENC